MVKYRNEKKDILAKNFLGFIQNALLKFIYVQNYAFRS